MLIRSFQEAEEIARKVGPKKISVLRAETENSSRPERSSSERLRRTRFDRG